MDDRERDRLSAARGEQRPPTAPLPDPGAAQQAEPSAEPTFERVREVLATPRVDPAQWVGVAALFVLVALTSGSSAMSFAALLLVVLARDVFRLTVMRALDVVDGRLLVLPLARGIVPVGRSAAREAVSILSGPVFMMVLSLAAYAAARFGVVFAKEIAWSAVVMAAFFLLPLKPYDGWKLLNLCLFSRWAVLEAVVAGVTSLAVVALGIKLQAWLLAAIGALQLIGVGGVLELHRASAAFKARAGATPPADTGQLDTPTLRLLYDDTRAHFSKVVAQQAASNVGAAAKTLANFMREVHARAARQVPSTGAAVLLMLIYAALVTYFIAGVFAVMVMASPAAR